MIPTVYFDNKGELVYDYPKFYKIWQFQYAKRVKSGRLLMNFAIIILPNCPLRDKLKGILKIP